MRYTIGVLIACLLISCSKKELDSSMASEVHKWNRELYKVNTPYQYINDVKVSGNPIEEFVSYKIIYLNSKQAQKQQDSLFQTSNGKYIYRFKRVDDLTAKGLMK
ncbi:hypothetical protein H8S90_16515 [Olivibacter sp. SDN3]|uniref:hypothetical protein n=1 Tax=Olivibacter sp. SDN3 TaxID=2764720 RepID=UPI001650F774|nr:hypothetical protein [Olivibacter sp. SDN3]QNL48388.1 hypothetical protein H8S90_16515 [Olivibacter sp. SDN3]